jgi:hypothetical protein
MVIYITYEMFQTFRILSSWAVCDCPRCAVVGVSIMLSPRYYGVPLARRGMYQQKQHHDALHRRSRRMHSSDGASDAVNCSVARTPIGSFNGSWFARDWWVCRRRRVLVRRLCRLAQRPPLPSRYSSHHYSLAASSIMMRMYSNSTVFPCRLSRVLVYHISYT